LLKFYQIVFRKFLVIFLVLFLVVGAIVYYWTKDIYITQTQESLLNEIELLSFNIQKEKNFDNLALKIKENLHVRATFIDQNGKVLAESHKDKTQMDNHKYRDEVMQANENDFGAIIRHSKTIDKDFLYVVKKFTLRDGSLYIRLSKELKSINEQILSLGLKILAVISLFLMAIFFIAIQITKKIEYETQKIANFLTSLTKKNKETYIDSDFSLEFTHITKLLTKVSQIIVKKEKQKAKYTQKLQLSNKQKDDIISAISHEFKNPIAVINGYSQTLLEDEEINPNIRKKFLTKIHNNGVKLSDLIDTLRLSIKLDSKKQSMNFVTINLYNILKENIENIKINYPNRKIKLEGEKSITIKVDSSLFCVVLSNLIENALKYSEDEIKIIFTTKRVDVVDSGIGISKKNLENITNKFFRVHENSWNNSLGLGLFIVNNIIKLHNFKLEINSVENEGSTFSVVF
jgi:signal transduction histidine kinase